MVKKGGDEVGGKEKEKSTQQLRVQCQEEEAKASSPVQPSPWYLVVAN